MHTRSPLSSRRPLLLLARRSRSLLIPLLVPAMALIGAPRSVQAQSLRQLPAGEEVNLKQKNSGFVPSSVSVAPIQVIVEMNDLPSSRVYSNAIHTGGATPAQAEARAEAHVTQLKEVQRALVGKLTAPDIGATPLYKVQRAYNGVAVTVFPDNIAKIMALPGVKAVHQLVPKTRKTASSVNFLGTPSFWNAAAAAGLNVHGEGVKVAVMDSGIDYLHTDFGGTGTGYSTLNSTTTPGNGVFPNARVKGGYDFAGDAYTAAASGTGSVPQPDPNPFDCNPNANPSYPADPGTIGHGTGAAGIAVGSGVNADGTTYTGPYDNTTPLASMRVGPGIAPKADIYALRVFGCEGSTNLVIQALDWCLDPAHKMDVVSASLGADQGASDDPDSAAASNAAAQGLITVFAAGNAGDTYYATGSPSSGMGAIAVAASYNDAQVYAAVNVSAPFTAQDIAYPAAFGPALTAAGVTGKVVYAQPALAGTALTNAAAIAGNIALVDRGTFSFKTKVLNAQNAGAIGVIIANNGSAITNPGDDATITTPITIPSVLIAQADGAAIEAVVKTDTTSPVTATLTAAGPSGGDNIPAYTSRGPRRNDSALKPDVTAPAEVVNTAANGTGNGTELFNGTSSATPHVAGAMALMKQIHPTWTVEQLKALVMNTADKDLFSAPNKSGAKYGLGRVGAGRMDLATAAKANVVAYAANASTAPSDYAPVNVNYGAVDVPVTTPGGTLALPKTINVVNKGATAVTYTPSFVSVGTDVPGVTFALPASVTVPAASGGTDGTATFNITMNAVVSQLRHSHDPTIALTQGGAPRHWLAEATGYVVLTPNDSSPALRLSVYAAPRPTSDLHVTSTTLTAPTVPGTINVTVAGSGLDTGEPSPAYPTDIISLGKALELQYVSPADATTSIGQSSADLKHVGVASDYAARGGVVANTVLNFAVATFGDHAAPDAFNTEIDINIDTAITGTFSAKYSVYNFLTGASRAYNNVYFPFIYNVTTGATTQGTFNLNDYSAGLDTNIFNNNVLLYPLKASSIGLTTGNTRFRYQVNTFYNGVLIDQTPVLTYDPAAPGIVEAGNATEPFLDQDAAGTLSFTFNPANMAANHSRGIMVTHLHNSDAGGRSEVVYTAQPKIASFTPTSGPVGTPVVITGTGFTGATAVRFFNNVPALTFTVNSDTQITANVPPGAATGTLRVESPAGAGTSKTKFVVTLLN